MKRITSAATLLSLTIASALAHGQGVSDNSSGPYVGIAWGQFNLNLKNLNDVGAAVDTVTDSSDNAWKAYAGYRFNPYWSVEGAYIDFGSPNDSFQGTGSNGNYRVKMSGFAPNLIGTLPLGPVELFGKVGYYYYQVDTRVNFSTGGPNIQSKHTRSDYLYGVGVGMTFFEHFNVRAEYERIDIQNANNSDAFWLGGGWRF